LYYEKQKLLMLVAITGITMSSCTKQEELLSDPKGIGASESNRLKSIPANPNNKVAYYAFDATPVGRANYVSPISQIAPI